MSKKYYELLANIFKYGYDLGDLKQHTIINLMVDEFCKIAEDDNPRFNKDIFIKACRG